MTFGIIGTNFICDRFMNALAKGPHTAVAVYSRKQETGRAFAEKYGITAVFDSLEAFLSSDLFDAVYVASPNYLHEAHSIRSLESGKHVLCEKPIATSEKSFLRMQEAAKRSGCTLMEAMRPHHDVLWERVINSLDTIGKIRHAHLEYCQYSTRYDRHLKGEYTNAFDPALSNAAIMDIGIYPIAMAALLFGRPERVVGSSIILESGFEGAGNAILHYQTHTVTVAYSKIAESVGPSYILGEDGGICIDKLALPSRMDFRFRKEADFSVQYEEGDPDNMTNEILDFADFVSEGVISPFWQASADALYICDILRREANVRFPADAQDEM